MPKIGKYFRLCILILAHVCSVLLLSSSKVRGIADMWMRTCGSKALVRERRESRFAQKKRNWSLILMSQEPRSSALRKRATWLVESARPIRESKIQILPPFLFKLLFFISRKKRKGWDLVVQKSDIPGPVSLHPDPETGRRSPWGAMAETTMDTSSSSRASQPAKQVCAYST